MGDTKTDHSPLHGEPCGEPCSELCGELWWLLLCVVRPSAAVCLVCCTRK